MGINMDYHSSKLGDRVLRRAPRLKPWRVTITGKTGKKPADASAWTLIYGFAIMIGIGAVLLMLPWSSRSGEQTSVVNALFTATSSVCVTGLVVVDTLDYWSFFGQLVILLLIQLGGFGFMTSTSVFLIALGRHIGLRERILIGESIGLSGIGGVVRLARNIALFTLLAEAIGAVVFYVRFSAEYPWPIAAWKAVFQAVSSFNNAGFDLFGGFHSLVSYQNDSLVILTTAVLIILGGISFLVVEDVLRHRNFGKLSIDTKLVLVLTVSLLALGMVVVLVAESGNLRTLGGMNTPDKILNAFFQSVTSRTAGFSAISTGNLTEYALFFTMFLMFVGAASGSTAGGVKVNTFGVIIAAIWSTVRGRENPGVFGREFTTQQIFRALAVLVLYLGIVLVVVSALTVTEKFPFLNLLFETVSAVGTVGLSTGITPDLSIVGRLVITAVMFTGRLGPLTLTMALARAQHRSMLRYPKETVRIG